MNLDILGAVTNGDTTESITSVWSYDPSDPWAVKVLFPEQDVEWDFSLDLMREAFNSPPGQLHGAGHFQIELDGNSVFFHLSNAASSATLRFSCEDIRDFLDWVDDENVDEIVSRELEDFLEEL